MLREYDRPGRRPVRTSWNGVSSDEVLAAVRPARQQAGYSVETGKGKENKVWRPVLFGDEGQARVAYEVDAFHPGHGVVVEIEAGRSMRGSSRSR